MATLAEDAVILNKTLELCQLIVDQPTFQSLRQRIDAFLADDDARTQYQDVMDRGQSLHQKQSNAMPLAQEEIAEFEAKRDALMNNPLAKGFFEAQEDVHGVKETINRYVSRTFELGRPPGPEDFSSCGHGCSCGH